MFIFFPSYLMTLLVMTGATLNTWFIVLVMHYAMAWSIWIASNGDVTGVSYVAKILTLLIYSQLVHVMPFPLHLFTLVIFHIVLYAPIERTI